MKLPFVDEIRELRQRAEGAQRAAQHVGRIEGCLASLGMIERQQQLVGPVADAPLPGDALIQEIADDYPSLADLASATPRAGEPVSLRMHARRAQLEMARSALRSRADEAHRTGHDLHELQHRQQEALEDPRFTEDVRELAALRAERDSVHADLRPTEIRLVTIRPLRAVVDPMSARVRAELDHRTDPDPLGILAWRAGSVARAILESLAGALAGLPLEVPIPPPPVVPRDPTRDPSVVESLWWDVEGVAERLAELAAGLQAEQDRLTADHGRLSARYEELNRRILERTG